jgi:hypothetical protein
MDRHSPLVQLVMGLAACAFAAAYLVWLLLARGDDLADLPAAAFGSAEAVERLAGRQLATAAAVLVTVVHLAVVLVLTLLTAYSGVGLLAFWRSARWAAVFTGVFTAAVGVAHTLVRMIFLTPAGAPVKLTPFLMDAVAVLFAVVLVGTMFLPELTTAYGGDLTPAGPGAGESPSPTPGG